MNQKIHTLIATCQILVHIPIGSSCSLEKASLIENS